MRQLLAGLAALLSVAIGVPAASAEMVDEPQAVGDEMYPGHDLIRVRYSNKTGSVATTAWVGRLHASDQLGVWVATRDAGDYNFYISVKMNRGLVRALVYPFDFANGGLGYDNPTCVPRAKYDSARESIRVRAQDACFGDSDLSSVLMSTELGVRGKNYVSDMTSNQKVRRN